VETGDVQPVWVHCAISVCLDGYCGSDSVNHCNTQVQELRGWMGPVALVVDVGCWCLLLRKLQEDLKCLIIF